jgi:hypothetical protein
VASNEGGSTVGVEVVDVIVGPLPFVQEYGVESVLSDQFARETERLRELRGG